MINVKVFSMEDLDDFDSAGEFEDLKRDMQMNYNNPNMTILSLKIKELTLAILGVTEFRRGAGEVWLLPSKSVPRNKFDFFKTVKRLIYSVVFDELHFHRLELAIVKGDKRGKKWAKALGFRYSHLCREYDTTLQDHEMFYRLRSEVV